MTYDEFNAFCKSLTSTTYVMQWGDAHVWKIGGKVFAIGGWHDAGPAFTFKVSPMMFDLLQDQEGLRPAPYLASRGFSWLQCYKDSEGQSLIKDEELKTFIQNSYEIVALSLSKKKQKELGFEPISQDE